MREDKLPELGAKDPLFLYPHLELHWQTSIAVLSLSTLAAQDHRCILELGRPLVVSSETTLSLAAQEHTTSLAWGDREIAFQSSRNQAGSQRGHKCTHGDPFC